ncbi:2-dehydro-3-deoxyphosphooctonate aldolase [Leifsonia xyli subsp. cynodontis DSM 46306]|uniref:YdhG-like domain-containing protein n=1 Tax=Leifsonia xyli subsp. cynodontis DSM 46306 TaxID=1389489 RepID=U3P689_LEIXC|nr:DUF1801 domain-containing protein [Leifsonia xyli]AGW40969.1 2-dehydro-3-deoxyphosphooctonate aldolase [Leifsonia xyli subsp. cynodontis DSM 46306]
MTPSDLPVAAVLDRVPGPRRAEAERLLALHAEVSDEPPIVWAGRIQGFGEYHYRYASGHEGDAPLLGFASDRRRHTVYLLPGFADSHAGLLATLGPHTASKVCLYLPRLTGVDEGVLRQLLEATLAETRAQYGMA